MVLNLGVNVEKYIIESNTYNGTVLLSTLPGRNGEAVRAALTLRPHEGLIILLDS